MVSIKLLIKSSLKPTKITYPHIHEDYELFFLIEGARKFFLSHTICSIEKQNALLIPPFEPHQSTINQTGPLERSVLYISKKMLDTIIKENNKLCKFTAKTKFKIDDNAFAEILKLIDELQMQIELKDSYSEHYVKSIITQIIIILLRQDEASEKQNQISKFEKNDIRIQSPINYILENYDKQITLEKCASIANMSVSHFSRQFRQTTGIGFKEYLIKVRVDKACEFLRSGGKYSVTDLAIMCGFTDSSYFTSVFKKQTGKTPTQYKKENKQFKRGCNKSPKEKKIPEGEKLSGIFGEWYNCIEKTVRHNNFRKLKILKRVQVFSSLAEQGRAP